MRFNDDDRVALRKEIISLLVEYDYTPTIRGVDAIIDRWLSNKEKIIDLMEKHPNYNGKYQIAFDQEYSRKINLDEVLSFVDYLCNLSQGLLIRDESEDFFEIAKKHAEYEKLFEAISFLEENGISKSEILIEKKDVGFYEKDRIEVNKKYEEYITSSRIIDEVCYTEESADLYWRFRSVMTYFSEDSQLADENFAESVNKAFPDLKARAGQKISRILNKLCKIVGFDKDPAYNRRYAVYSDAINTLQIVRHTVLSVHPVDYLTMSFGNSWASCHTIDKKNKRGMPNDYEGCYSSGTLSYMQDNSSFVFYTVDKNYNGNELELQAKINRNMFHLCDTTLIQGRVYPQDNDSERGLYREIRNIVQKVISDCMGVPNLWVNKKGTYECGNVTCSCGTHYRDYLSYDNCNVSYLKDENGNINSYIIVEIGDDPICPVCGNSHDIAENIVCEDCREEHHICDNCGFLIDDNDVHEIDGHFYCSDCCFYCTYHQRWEAGEPYINNETHCLCEDAYYNHYVVCGYCGELINVNDAILTEDGHYFCSAYCEEKEEGNVHEEKVS